MALDPITAALDIGGKLLDKFFPNPQERAQAELELSRLRQTGELAAMVNETSLSKYQTDVNIEEAKSTNMFIAGWRPFIGWICGCGLGYQFLVYPMLIAYVPKIVQLDAGTLITLLGGMLGLGGLRTMEKLQGKAS